MREMRGQMRVRTVRVRVRRGQNASASRMSEASWFVVALIVVTVQSGEDEESVEPAKEGHPVYSDGRNGRYDSSNPPFNFDLIQGV